MENKVVVSLYSIVCLFVFFNFFLLLKVGVMAEAEMEEVARKDFQEEPGMMERSLHLSLVFFVFYQ